MAAAYLRRQARETKADRACWAMGGGAAVAKASLLSGIGVRRATIRPSIGNQAGYRRRQLTSRGANAGARAIAYLKRPQSEAIASRVAGAYLASAAAEMSAFQTRVWGGPSINLLDSFSGGGISGRRQGHRGNCYN